MAYTGRIDITVLKEVFSISVWGYAPVLYKCSHLVSVLRTIERLGEKRGIGCIEHCKKCFRPVFVIVNALAGVTGSLVSNLIGAGEKKQVFPLLHKIIRLDMRQAFHRLLLRCSFTSTL